MIAIVDYGMGNVGSIQNMLYKLAQPSEITRDAATIRAARQLILPGVGAFDHAMRNLKTYGLIELLSELVVEQHKPILGICLGMQLLGRSSEEGDLPGLGWLPAATQRLHPADGQRVPHMGWSETTIAAPHPLFRDLDKAKFYFVHSYQVVCDDERDRLATCQYGGVVTAAVGRGHVLGTQFHPEKSHRYGLRLLANFLELSKCPEPA